MTKPILKILVSEMKWSPCSFYDSPTEPENILFEPHVKEAQAEHSSGNPAGPVNGVSRSQVPLFI